MDTTYTDGLSSKTTTPVVMRKPTVTEIWQSTAQHYTLHRTADGMQETYADYTVLSPTNYKISQKLAKTIATSHNTIRRMGFLFEINRLLYPDFINALLAAIEDGSVKVIHAMVVSPGSCTQWIVMKNRRANAGEEGVREIMPIFLAVGKYFNLCRYKMKEVYCKHGVMRWRPVIGGLRSNGEMVLMGP